MMDEVTSSVNSTTTTTPSRPPIKNRMTPQEIRVMFSSTPKSGKSFVVVEEGIKKMQDEIETLRRERAEAEKNVQEMNIAMHDTLQKQREEWDKYRAQQDNTNREIYLLKEKIERTPLKYLESPKFIGSQTSLKFTTPQPMRSLTDLTDDANNSSGYKSNSPSNTRSTLDFSDSPGKLKIEQQRTQELTQTLAEKDKIITSMQEEKTSMQEELDHLKTEISTHQPMLERFKIESLERKSLFNQLQELKGNIRVFCRVRPLTKDEEAREERNCSTFPHENSIMISGKKYDFDKVFEPVITQDEVFNEVKPLVMSVMDGYNVCLFAYGQTGSGKTWTMEGNASNRGVNFRSLTEIFQTVKEKESLFSYSISISVVEIYNENVRDLLSTESKKLEIRQIANNGVGVPDLVLKKVENIEQVQDLMSFGAKNRAVGATNQNEHSSRSHCIISVTVEGLNKLTGISTSARLHLVDLAGSERLSKTLAEGDRLKEAQHINKSLSALGDVISALVAKSSHIPYRNSKLTHLLMDSLGGDGKTLMFVNINPTEPSSGESVCSLNFAARVRSVEMGPAKKHTSDVDFRLKEQSKKYKEELKAKDEIIEQLRAQLKTTEDKATRAEGLYFTMSDRYKQLSTVQKEHTDVKKVSEPKITEHITTSQPMDTSSVSSTEESDDVKENAMNTDNEPRPKNVRFASSFKNSPEKKRIKLDPSIAPNNNNNSNKDAPSNSPTKTNNVSRSKTIPSKAKSHLISNLTAQPLVNSPFQDKKGWSFTLRGAPKTTSTTTSSSSSFSFAAPTASSSSSSSSTSTSTTYNPSRVAKRVHIKSPAKRVRR